MEYHAYVRKRLLFSFALLAATSAYASAQQLSMPLWPNGTPEGTPATGTEHDTTKPSDDLIAGKPLQRLTDISQPSLALYKPANLKADAPAVVVFPGGGYQILAYDLEGTEVCSWLNSISVTCVLVKYRVPFKGHYPDRFEDLEDAQQAVRLTRSHAAEWQIDPHKIGVLGFSAGGHLAVTVSNHSDYQHPGAAPNAVSARPDFAVVIYPGYLVAEPVLDKLSPGSAPNANTPPTFLVQAEDDPVHEENALVYYQVLKDAKIPAELHIYAKGGHGYGLRPTDLPVTHWPSLVETWLHSIQIL